MRKFTNVNQPGLDQNAYNEFTGYNEIVHQEQVEYDTFANETLKNLIRRPDFKMAEVCTL